MGCCYEQSTCLLWRRQILRRVVGDSMGSATRQISEKKPGAFTMKFLQRRSTTHRPPCICSHKALKVCVAGRFMIGKRIVLLHTVNHRCPTLHMQAMEGITCRGALDNGQPQCRQGP